MIGGLAGAAAIVAAILLLFTSWETESVRHRRQRLTEWQNRLVPSATHLAQEVRLSAWLYLGLLIWLHTRLVGVAGTANPPVPSSLAGGLLHDPIFRAGLLAPLVLVPVGWLLGRAAPFPAWLRFLLAPFHGLSLWILWLLGRFGERRSGKAPDQPAGGEPGPDSRRKGVLDLASISVGEVMVPRSQVVLLEGSRSVREAAREVRRVPHSLYPVFDGSIESPLGLVAILDLAAATDRSRPIADLARAVPIVPETMKGLDLLEDLSTAELPAALVVDEFGGMAGLVTLEDLIEVILGDVVGEHEVVRARIVELGSNLYRVEGTCTVEEFNERFQGRIPEGEYETVAGYFLDATGTIPEEGERIDLGDLRLEVGERTERRILWLRVETGRKGTPPAGGEHPRRSSQGARG